MLSHTKYHRQRAKIQLTAKNFLQFCPQLPHSYWEHPQCIPTANCSCDCTRKTSSASFDVPAGVGEAAEGGWSPLQDPRLRVPAASGICAALFAACPACTVLSLLCTQTSSAKSAFFILDFGIFPQVSMPQMCAGFVVSGEGGGKKKKTKERQILSLGNLRWNFHVDLPS